MTRPDKDPSVFHEPFGGAPSSGHDALEDEPALTGRPFSASVDDEANHNVWDEPVTAAGGTIAPEGAPTYSAWFAKRYAVTSDLRRWLITLGLATIGGLFAVVGTLIQGLGYGGLLGLVVVGPAIEEMLKVGATLLVLEDRPYLFRSPAQIFITVAAAAIGFAAIENFMYIYLYHPGGGPAFILWRWAVCLPLHLTASTTAAFGLYRMWRNSLREAPHKYYRPQLQDAFPLIVAAVVLHGGYNAFASVFEAVLHPF